MIQVGSFLNVIDNSGAKKACCIKIVKGYKKRYAKIGDVITVSIKSIRKKRKRFVKANKGEIYKALVVRTIKSKGNFSGYSLRFFENSVVLLNKKNKLIGTRVFNALPSFLRQTKYIRLLSICSGFIN
jgi:large subunit ribosomal protein L14